MGELKAILPELESCSARAALAASAGGTQI
jgi:hypothetical protein